MKIHEEQMGSGGTGSDVSNACPNLFPEESGTLDLFLSSASDTDLCCS